MTIMQFTRIQRLRFSSYFLKQVYLPYAKFSYVPIFMFLSFIIGDIIHFGDAAFWPAVYRFTLCSMMLSATYYIKNYRPKTLQAGEVLLLLSGSLFLVYIAELAFVINNTNYQDGIMLVLVYIGTFSRLSLRYSATALTGALIIYLVGISPTMYVVEQPKEIERLTLYFSTYILCLTACIRRELEYINQFKQTQQIRSQQLTLAAQSAKLKIMALTDPLTELHNRLYLQRVIEPNIIIGQPLAIMMIDIDHFKRINDQFGHIKGDKILQELAKVMKNSIGNKGHVVRFGGEEFLIVCNIQQQHDFEQLADRLLNAVHCIAIGSTTLSVSIGTYYTPYLSQHLDDVIHQADACLYQSKNNGRNCITHYQ